MGENHLELWGAYVRIATLEDKAKKNGCIIGGPTIVTHNTLAYHHFHEAIAAKDLNIYKRIILLILLARIGCTLKFGIQVIQGFSLVRMTKPWKTSLNG